MDLSNTISITIICKNAESTLGECLAACLLVTDDVIVVDSHSTDATISIVKQSNARLLQSDWLGYGATKNYAADQSKYDWILSIDSDEVLSDELIEQLKNLNPSKNTVYRLDRMTNYCGQWIKHSGWYPDWISRLYPKDNVRWNLAEVHEQLIIPKNYLIKKLEGKLYHYSYRKDEEHIIKIDRYAKLAAERDITKGKPLGLLKRHLGPTFRFVKSYFLKRGFLDGKVGLTLAKRNASFVRKYITYYDRLGQ